MPKSTKPAAARRRVVKSNGRTQSKAWAAALRRRLKQRMPRDPESLRRSSVLRGRLEALRPELPPSARREVLRLHLQTIMPSEPGGLGRKKARR